MKRMVFGRAWMFVLLVTAGCAASAARRCIPTECANPVLLGPESEIESLPAFQKLKALRPGTPAYETGSIHYLIERISRSKRHFMRNGETFGGQRAAMHLRWKFRRQHEREMTAEAFIDEVASRSKLSGKEYLVRGDRNEYYSLRQTLLKELEILTAKRDPALKGTGVPADTPEGP
ncbi:MAG: hypothetical protein A2Y02_01710 [Omnitrophica bacterium GWA2_52_12]|nr:MAG: hypothetical protein A2Y02_01710 [Omnitrophica bacterium GWA2_52_12]